MDNKEKKGFYIENFALRLLFCVVGMIAIWVAVRYVMTVLIFHEEFVFDPVRLILLPTAFGVVEAFVWKPKE